MNRTAIVDDRNVVHLMNLFTGNVLTYALVTRGGLAVARGFEYVTGRAAG